MKINIDKIENISSSAEQFVQLALKDSSAHIFAFYGSMGAGKTTFIKALCEALGVSEEVTSPTFAIVNEYTIDEEIKMKDEGLHANNSSSFSPPFSSIFHFDFYRIHRLEEVYDMGYEDYFYNPTAICFIEWPELIEELLPDDTVRVTISEQPDGSRLVEW